MAADRDAFLKRYRDGYRAVVEALDGITEEELDRRGSPDEWTPREIVHHLADSEMTSALRLRTLLATENPVIYGYDEKRFAQRLTLGRPIEPSLDAFRAARESTADIVERLDDQDLARFGWHTENGAYGVRAWMEIYAAHAHDHADQIRRARGR